MEILFRGKTECGTWVYGSLIQAGDYCCILDADDVDDLDYPYLDKDLGTIDGSATPVNSNTIGQFIGMYDASGRRIFDGDIIRFHKYAGEPDWTGSIRYENGLYLVVGTIPFKEGPFEIQLSGIDKSTIQVIGNMYDDVEVPDVPPLDICLEQVYGHWNVYIDSMFYCSADSVSEAYKEIDEFVRKLENSKNPIEI